ncbi:hypothetical protein ACS0TY_034830 [Phlomoides rotata]
MERTTPELELYTIPSYSSWFSWNNIHEVERFTLREFFDGTSVTRTPRIYKDYRDFIISKYREDPSRKLTFTDVRKSLVGDISVLIKVFSFLEKWGLINFNVSDTNNDKSSYDGSAKMASVEEEGNWKGRVKVEEGAPHGVRVVAAPNSMKPIVPPPPPPFVAVDGGGFVGEVGESGFKWPPLASYSDVYGELMQQETKNSVVCGSCKEICDPVYYEYTKEGNLIFCEKCFKSGKYEKDKSADDFKFKLNETVNQAAVWTEAETLLLLESALKHGDDWDLVAKNVQTKSRQECISKLIQLPFGDLMLGAGNRKSRYLDVIGAISNSKQASGEASHELQELVKAEDPSPELQNKDQQIGDNKSEEGPPQKRVCIEPSSDVGSSLMKQVTRISTMLGPHVTASAADAAVTSLCYENQCSKELFDDDDDNYVDSKASPEASNEERDADVDNTAEDKRPNQSGAPGISSGKSIIPLNLRTRAATATTVGVAAANAKLLADQEEREIGELVATMIEAQVPFPNSLDYSNDKFLKSTSFMQVAKYVGHKFIGIMEYLYK